MPEDTAMPLTLPRDQWAKAALAGEALGAFSIRKSFTAEIKDGNHPVELGDLRRVLTFAISTGAVDRSRDRIEPMGWQVEEYLKNPVVMWAHDYKQLPIGRALSVSKTDQGLTSTAEFVSGEINPFAESVYQLCAKGFLNAASVGFRPLEWSYDETRKGFDFKKTALFEWSVVPIPDNPETLIQARGFGIDTAPIRQWAEEWLSLEHGAGFWMAKATLEEVWKASAPKTPLFVGGWTTGKDIPLIPATTGIITTLAPNTTGSNGETKFYIDGDDPIIEKPPKPEPPKPEPAKEAFFTIEDLDGTWQVELEPKPLTVAALSQPDVMQLIRESLNTALYEVVGTEVDRTLNRLRGRVD